VPPEDMGEFSDFLTSLGYAYCDESQNPVYQLFLG
jgi:threonine dehydratase